MCEPRQVETARSRLVRVVRLAPDRSHGLRGGMRRMGATCTAAQTHMHSRRIPSQEYDQNGAESGGGDALPSEWRPCASQRPTARVAGCGSAKFRLLTCDRRHQHTISAKTSAVFWPHERLAPRNPPGDQIGRARGRRRANEGKVRKTDAYGPRSRGLQFLRGESGWTVHSSYLRKAGAGRGRRGDATRPRLRGESQEV